MIVISVLLISLLVGLKVILGASYKKPHFSSVIAYVCFAIMVFFLLFRLEKFPNVFIDEENCAYESWCLAHFGVDSNLIHNPIYFQSFMGQGQSVLYAYLALPFIKYLGYSFLVFRLPLVIVAVISTLSFLYVISKYYLDYLPYVAVVMCSCPYLLTEARYGMDCNIAIWLMLLGISIFIDAFKEERQKWIIIKYCGSFLVLGLVAYSYNVSWLYLPFLIIGLIILMVKNREPVKALIIATVLLIIEITPILIFAIRSNYQGWNETKQFFFFTSPELLHGRANDSIIAPITLHNMVSNAIDGLKQLFINGDGLAWNSLPGSIAFYLFASLPFLVGLIYILKHLNEEINQLFIILLTSNVLIFLIVKPNYNHWMFIFIPIIYSIAIGLYVVTNHRKYIGASIFLLYMVSFLLFANSYFKTPRYTGMYFDTYKSVRLIESKSKGQNIYIQSTDPLLMLTIRDFNPCSPYVYQSTKDHPYSRKKLPALNKYKNYYRVLKIQKYKKGSLILTSEDKTSLPGSQLIDKHIAIGSSYYNVFEVK